MRDDQRERYARHIALPEIGEPGQTALLSATARIVDNDPAAAIAGRYLVAAGVDTQLHAEGCDVVLAPRPAWWPGAADDEVALAFWRGAIAATHWIDEVIRRSTR